MAVPRIRRGGPHVSTARRATTPIFRRIHQLDIRAMVFGHRLVQHRLDSITIRHQSPTDLAHILRTGSVQVVHKQTPGATTATEVATRIRLAEVTVCTCAPKWAIDRLFFRELNNKRCACDGELVVIPLN